MQDIDHAQLNTISGGNIFADAGKCAIATMGDVGTVAAAGASVVSVMAPPAAPIAAAVSTAATVAAGIGGFFSSMWGTLTGHAVCPTSLTGYRGPAER